MQLDRIIYDSKVPTLTTGIAALIRSSIELSHIVWFPPPLAPVAPDIF